MSQTSGGIFQGAWAIAQGMAITFKTMWKPSCVVQYPTQKLVPYERFRGALLFDPEYCIACNKCVKACPSNCIALENATNPETKKKVAKVDWYSIDFGKCNFCRLCEESCPTEPKSVWHSLDYGGVLHPRRDGPLLEGRVRLHRNFRPPGQGVPRPTGQISIHEVQPGTKGLNLVTDKMLADKAAAAALVKRRRRPPSRANRRPPNDRVRSLLVLAAVVVISALLVVTARNTVHCACFGLGLAVAGLFASLGQDFLFGAQILVYVGGIAV